MSEQIRIVDDKRHHMSRMRTCLEYSFVQVRPLLPRQDWSALTPDQHESRLALRVRFSECQEHLSKAMQAVAKEVEQDVERFCSVLAFMERPGIIDSTERWKSIRKLRNAVNRECEDNAERLTDFFSLLMREGPVLFGYVHRPEAFCAQAHSV